MFFFKHLFVCMVIQKQPPIGVPKKRRSENMQQIYRRTAMPKCDFNKVAIEITLRHGCSPVNLLHLFRTPFPKNTSEWLLLVIPTYEVLHSSAFHSFSHYYWELFSLVFPTNFTHCVHTLPQVVNARSYMSLSLRIDKLPR